MDKLKRIIGVFLCVLLISISYVPAMAASNETEDINTCSHSSTITTRVTLQWEITSSTHLIQYQNVTTCRLCGAIVSVETEKPISGAHREYYVDGGHSGSVHLWKYVCSVCGHERVVRVPCSGNPHIHPV